MAPFAARCYHELCLLQWGRCNQVNTTPVNPGGTIVKISASNRLKGKIVEVKKGATPPHVRLDVNRPIVTASLTNEAVDALALKVGQEGYAIINEPDAMFGLI